MILSGWWSDDGRSGIAHFYEDGDQRAAVAPACAPDGEWDEETDRWAALVIVAPDREPRPFVDMGDATGKPCAECMKRLEAPMTAPRRGVGE